MKLALAVLCAGLLAACLWLVHSGQPEHESHTDEHTAAAAPAPRAPVAVSAHAIAARIASVLPHVDAPPDDTQPLDLDAVITYFAPHPGEDLLTYRDRILPVVEEALTPQRQRVATARATFEQAAELDPTQKKALDDAVAAAGDAIKDRIMQAFLSGELARLKPMAVTSFARSILDAADDATQKFRASLRPDQQQALDDSDFDLIDYIAFATRWEDLLGVTHP